MTSVFCARPGAHQTPRFSETSLPQQPAAQHPWHKLPVEITEHILAQWHGKDTVNTVRRASQVDRSLAHQVQRAQPEAFAELQQQTMLGFFDPGSQPLVDNERLRSVLRRYHHVAFHLVPRAADIEERMLEADAETLALLPEFMPRVDTLDLRGLKHGPALFAHWARNTPWLHGIERLMFDARRLTEDGLDTLLKGTLCTTMLKTLSAMPKKPPVTFAAGHPRASGGGFSGSLDVEATVPLDCSHLNELQTFNMSGCGLDLSLLQLQDNHKLRHLDLSGNFGVGHLLLGPGAPRGILETLVLSPDGVAPEALAHLSAAPWAAAVKKLALVGDGQKVPSLNLATFDGLTELTLKGQAVDYEHLRLPQTMLASLDLTDTGLSADNPLAPDALQQPQLWRLQLAHNALHGALHALNLFAAPSLLVLDLGSAFLRDVDIIHWQVPKHNRLRYLNLSNNKIGQRGMRALMQKPLLQLRYLGLTMADRRAAADVAKVLQETSSLKEIWPNLEILSLSTHHQCDPSRQEALQDFLAQDAIACETIDLAQLSRQAASGV